MIRCLVIAVAVVLLASCTRSYPGIQPDELRITARWIEDVAHGIPRRAGELELVTASADHRRVALWAGGDEQGEHRAPPLQVQARLRRWTALAAALRSHLILIDPASGLVGPAPDLTPGDFTLAADIADPENRDRRTIDAIVLARAQASAEATAWYAEAVRQARLELDTQAGGTPWTPPAKKSPAR